MAGRLQDKVALITGAGSVAEGWGNGKATAVLFTPIAVGLANGLALPIEPFAVAVVFAANCSFASPVGYQTNLLVMAPGNYRFVDFVRVGTPLLIIVWLIFSLVAPWYYGLI